MVRSSAEREAFRVIYLDPGGGKDGLLRLYGDFAECPLAYI